MIADEQKASFNYTVTTDDLAQTVGIEVGDRFPDVLSTSRAIALMEVASARLMASVIRDSEFSVGVGVDVVHQAATPVGESIEVTAMYKGKVGKLYNFEVEVADAGGVVAKGVHSRAVVDGQRLLTGADKRIAEAKAR